MTGKISLSALRSGAILTDASGVGGKSDIAAGMQLEDKGTACVPLSLKMSDNRLLTR